MEFNIINFIILAIVSFFYGIIAIMVGIGGGLLNVPTLIYGFDMIPNQASFISTFAIIFTSSSGFIKYRSKNQIDFKTVKKYLIYAVPGTILGSILAAVVEAQAMKMWFGVIVGIAGIRGILKAQGIIESGKPPKEVTENPPKGYEYRHITLSDGTEYKYNIETRYSVPFAFVGGFVAGLFGLGGGIVYMPLMAFAGVPVHIAVATSATMIVVVSFIGLFVKGIALNQVGLLDLTQIPQYGLAIALGAVFGARLGAGKVTKIKSKTLLTAFWTIALISGIRMVGWLDEFFEMIGLA